MNKKLFTQIKNEWRSNLWLAIELLLVSVVMWYIVDSLYCTTATYLEPKGFDIEHCYHIEMGCLNEKSPDYVPYQSGDEQRDVNELINRLQHRPDIEAVSFSSNSYPYNGSNSTTEIQPIGGDQISGNIIRRMVTPDFVRVFRYTGVNGETPEQLAQMVEEGKFLLSENLCKFLGGEPNELVGKPFYLHGDTTRTRILGAVLNSVRYSDYARRSSKWVRRSVSAASGSMGASARSYSRRVSLVRATGSLPTPGRVRLRLSAILSYLS